QARALLRHLWRTQNPDTFILPGSEEAGMEAVLVNLLEPGDVVVIGVSGYSGERLAQAAERVGGQVVPVEATWGETVSPASVEAALITHKPRLVALVHGEASTGVMQPLADVVDLAHRHGALCVADVCSTTAVVEVPVDDWKLDACWAGSQKGLSAYPGV